MVWFEQSQMYSCYSHVKFTLRKVLTMYGLHTVQWYIHVCYMVVGNFKYPVYTGRFKPVRNRFQLLSSLIEVSVNAPKSISKRLESDLNRFL